MKLLTCGNGVQPAGWTVNETKPLGFSRVYYIEDGEVWYNDCHGTRELHRHRLYIFPSVKAYSIHHNPSSPISCLWLHLDLSPAVVSELISVPVEEGSSFDHLLRSIQGYFLEEGARQPSFLSMVEAMTAYCTDHGWLPQPDGKLPEILTYLDAHFAQNLSIEEISRHFHYTPEHFIRLFQRELNLTPYQYLIQRRMWKAEGMLLSDIPVKEVAIRVGYQDAKVFAYRFKQVFGVSPSLYKKSHHPMA